jgi:putative endonuclease
LAQCKTAWSLSEVEAKHNQTVSPLDFSNPTKMLIMAYMYILECCDESFYTGSTNNLPRRILQHQNGMGANHTAKRLPVKLVYAEEFEHVADAFYREKQVQGWSRAKKMALIQGEWDKLRILAECQNESHCWGSGFGSAQPANTSAQPAEDLRAELSRSPDSESR